MANPPRTSYSAPPALGGGNPLVRDQGSGAVDSSSLYPWARPRSPVDLTPRELPGAPPAPTPDETYQELNSDRRRNKTPAVTRFISAEEAAQIQADARAAEREAREAPMVADLRQEIADLRRQVAAKVPAKPSAELPALREALTELRAELKTLREQSAATMPCANCGSAT
jgi:hypothetical protein